MYTWSWSLLRVTCVALIIMAMGCLTVQSDPEPMARPTRPKVFTTPEELRQYLDLVWDYYALNSKPRYGKRADNYHVTNALGQPINILRMIMAIDRQKQRNQQLSKQQQEQLEREEPSKLQEKLYPSYEHLNRYYEMME